MQKEIFKDIPGYEGLYQVSNLGNVKSLSRKICSNQGCYMLKEKILGKRIAKDGYYITDLCKNSNKKTYKIHQLVAMAFLKHKLCGLKLVVDHINGEKLNNNLENLQVITNRENSSKDKKGYTSKYIGVSFLKSRNKWSSQIYFNGKTIHLGNFKNEYEAHLCYQNKLKEILIKK